MAGPVGHSAGGHLLGGRQVALGPFRSAVLGEATFAPPEENGGGPAHGLLISESGAFWKISFRNALFCCIKFL
jgi:hypothetical protein